MIADTHSPILSDSSLPIIATSTRDIYKGTYLNKPCALKVFRGVKYSAEAKRVSTIEVFLNPAPNILSLVFVSQAI